MCVQGFLLLNELYLSRQVFHFFNDDNDIMVSVTQL
jgi:hypothetical protein